VSAPAPAHPPRRISPSAIGDDLRRFLTLTYTLAKTDFKLTFFGSVLGYLWTLMRPLLFFGLLYLVFTTVFDIGDDVKNYPLYLLMSIVLWTYFAEATASSVRALTDQESLLRKVRFPRMAIPLSVALTKLFNLGLNLVAVLLFLLISGITPRLGWLWTIPLILLLVVLVTGIAMFLSALFPRYRDLGPIWDITTQALFYGSPILYVVSKFPDNLERIAMCNPLSMVFTQMRYAVLDPDAPSAATAIGGYPRLLIPLGIVAVVFAVGLWVFNRETPRIAESL